MRSVRHGYWLCTAVFLWALIFPVISAAESLTLSLQEVELREVMQMLSRQGRTNILVADGVDGEVSINLYDVELEQAIYSIVDAAGFAVEKRGNNYFIIPREDAGKYNAGGMTQLRTYKIQYSSTNEMETIVRNHLSSYGKITKLNERKMLVVEDTPEFLDRIDQLLKELDREPRQILIEAKILQVTLQDNESYGLDWSKLFTSDGGEGRFGTRGLSGSSTNGFYFELLTPNIEVLLDTLKTRGRLRTLSTPKLLTIEDKEASAVVGDRIGFKVTTTTNQVTTESIEFLESGVILKVTPSVNEHGQVLLKIAPEVSTGTVSDDGIPSKNTTQVMTNMLVPDGQTVFIGGLMKQSIDESREGVPILGDIPAIGLLFSNRAKNIVNTETVVLITPKIVGQQFHDVDSEIQSTRDTEGVLKHTANGMKLRLDTLLDGKSRVVTPTEPMNPPEPPVVAPSAATNGAERIFSMGEH